MLNQRTLAGPSRRGNILVLTAFFMVALMGVLAFAIDLGYMNVVRAELQRSADAAAVAAAWELAKSSPTSDLSAETANARSKAIQFAAANKVTTLAPVVDGNSGNSSGGDVVVGYLADPTDPAAEFDLLQPSMANSVQVRVRKTSSSANGAVPMFFARVLGITQQDMQAQATAALMNNVGGFKTPSSGGNLQILPFALDKATWDDLVAGGGNDQWRWDDAQKKVVGGVDSVREVNLYPQGTGSPGNRGTVDIGSSNNSTSDIARQIVHGISPSDMDHIGGELKFNNQGKLYLNGDTGISAGVKDELASIIGKTRIIPIFEAVHGPGNNAEYTIVQFAGVRIMDVSLTGKMSSKRLIVQPARVFAQGGIPADGAAKSWFVYSPAWLVR